MEQKTECDEGSGYYSYWGKARTRLEVDYRSDKLSEVEICKEYSISQSEIEKKARRNGWEKLAEGERLAGCHLLPYHCLDVAAVGSVLLQRNSTLAKEFQQLSQLSIQTLQPWLLFMLAIHDLGKFSEAFQQFTPDLRQAWWGNIKKTRYDTRHDSLGHLLWCDPDMWQEAIDDEGGFVDADQLFPLYANVLNPWIKAVTGHHGMPPQNTSGTRYVRAYFRNFDIKATNAFVSDLFQLFTPDLDVLVELSRDIHWLDAQRELSWLLAGFAVLSDWLGSDETIFKYHDQAMPLADYWNNVALPCANQAVEKAGVLPALASEQKSFNQLFEQIADATPLQKVCDELEEPKSPQLFILEDVTGAGKTEAALTLVHKLMANGQGEGVFVALPTMATANAMYGRMAKVYRALFADDASPSLILSHSARHLSELFQQSLLNVESIDLPYNRSDETASIQCARWLADHRKKALLADVGVGTVDQALLGVLPAKHQSLRLLGLSNKVLLVDEVHAYDHYMFPLLKMLLQFHARLGGSAILLSATLPEKMRQELVNAYQRGRGSEITKIKNSAYPLMTQIGDGVLCERPVDTRSEVARQVGVKCIHNEKDVIAKLQETAEAGQCACWIRNTVHDAREAYAVLADEEWIADDKLMLFHSRFVLADRLEREQQTLGCFGEGSTAEQRCGRILVATQVVEQSLDLDFDLIVSDLAPIDLLIQRGGRLHRHVRNSSGERLYKPGVKDQRQPPLFYLFSPEMAEAPDENWFKSLFPKANYVYPHTGYLWRTARLLGKSKGWRMPEDARELIDGVYGEDAEPIPEELEKASDEAEGEWRAESGLANFNTLTMEQGYTLENVWSDEAKIPTRLAEDSVTLYLAKVENSRLRPLRESGRYSWDLSSINVPLKRVKGFANVASDRVLVDRFREENQWFSKEGILIPMVVCGDAEWRGEFVGEQRNVDVILYSQAQGVIFDSEGAKEIRRPSP